MHLIDSHAHLTSDAVFGQLETLLLRAKEADISAIVNICTDKSTLERGLALQRAHPWIYNAAASTPHDVDKEGEALFPLFAAHARGGDLVAVGETGLDYHYKHSAVETQKEFLRRYLHLAGECALPVVIHCRDAFADFFEILDAEYRLGSRWAPGVLHCFTGTVQEAEEVIRRGWYLSLSGIVTFKRSEELKKVAAMVPLDQLLIETDTPYLAPQSKRGKSNEPAYLQETAALIAAVKQVSLAELAAATSANARALFRI